MRRKTWAAVLITIVVLLLGNAMALAPRGRFALPDGGRVAAWNVRLAAWRAQAHAIPRLWPEALAPSALETPALALALAAAVAIACWLLRRGRRRSVVRLARRGRPTAAIARGARLSQDAVRALLRT